MKKNLVKKGQVWKSKAGNITLTIVRKATGNLHWTATTDKGKSHHVHEGTLQKFYVLA